MNVLVSIDPEIKKYGLCFPNIGIEIFIKYNYAENIQIL